MLLLKLIVATAFTMHGMAHISGFLVSIGKNIDGFHNKAWIFSSGLKLSSPAGRIFGIFWLLSLISFIVAGISIFFHVYWWQYFAQGGAVLSIIAMFPWWKAIPQGAKIGLFFDLLVLVVLLSPYKQTILDFLK